MNNIWCILLGCWDFNFLPTNGFSIKTLKVKLLAGEQKATEMTFRLNPHCDMVSRQAQLGLDKTKCSYNMH